MRGFPDIADDVDEPNDARMNFRTKARIKATIQRAAALSGVDDTAFTINAAYKSALETIAAHERTLLQPADHAAFFDALDNAPAPTPQLKQAFDRYRKTVILR
ncbi:uncharacterized protein (DUF1778 family) [Rhizobium sp. SG_E_25_P2]|uniref:type II toxin-antitoxin system TacA family antitoxin n=1 Tax=Rhizobium sp. SG_E_25_P2 TaxID=2879942 RepID=UPI0024730CB6|nr:DUF1778 domain-containing protein [Rhizobium sp. SG_E_25_P2]MDH6266612.1 uncharacterized protein (DUF1778 family) [Rhizobium sp. SG_E_25_P2]